MIAAHAQMLILNLLKMIVNFTKKYLRINVGILTQHAILLQPTKIADRYLQNITTEEII